MKNIFISVIISVLVLVSCTSDDTPEVPEFAMTAKINGVTFQANNPYGTHDFSSTNIWNYFPIEDFVMLQGRAGGVIGGSEINIWLKRSDIFVGTFQIGEETFSTPSSHFIDLNDNSNNISEYTKQGTIVITDVDTSTKIVQGTFEFTTVQNLGATSIDFNVTNGAFYYKYE